MSSAQPSAHDRLQQQTPAKTNSFQFPTSLPQHDSLDSTMPMDVQQTNNSMSMAPPSAPADSTFSPFHIPMSGFGHLPTPQSPNSLSQFVAASFGAPESPLNPAPRSDYPMMGSSSLGTMFHRPDVGLSQPFMMTPESSPMVSRNGPPTTPGFFGTPAPNSQNETPMQQALSFAPTTPKSNPLEIRLESPISISTPSQQGSTTVDSQLSSPFMARINIAEQRAESKSRSPEGSEPPSSGPMMVDDVFSSGLRNSSSATSVPLFHQPPAGGELARIKLAQQVALEEQQRRHQESESRKPDYLRRQKRTLAEADPTAFGDDERVGIFDSPHKGRRIKLFQETSEESFEESLMAGGYGRYRTADWVRQPQPLVVAAPAPVAPTPKKSPPVEVNNEPPSEKELLKRRRLSAFRGDGTLMGPVNKLYPIEIAGRGRVLVDKRTEEQQSLLNGERKRGGAAKKGKKKGAEVVNAPSKRTSAPGGLTSDAFDQPNWPDAEFPWRLRSEAHIEQSKKDEAERLHYLERYLDRDSDDEDDSETSDEESDEEIMPSTQYGAVYEDDADRPVPPRRGRGKMIGLRANPNDFKSRRRQLRKANALFPSDPADARAALMAKRQARAFQFHQSHPEKENRSNEIVCKCKEHDDGRELVLCDKCEKWYHLQCIGIKDVQQLGEEADMWYCPPCAKGRAVTPPEVQMQDYEDVTATPVLAPTDERLKRPSTPDHHATLFRPPESPIPQWISRGAAPKTPTRSRVNSGGSLGLGLPMYTGSLLESNRLGPSTPRQGSFYDALDLPTTPSRGTKFAGSLLQTPKNVFSRVAIQTPRPVLRKPLGAPGTLSAVLDEGPLSILSPFHPRQTGLDDTPVRRARPEAARVLRPSLSTPRYLGHYSMDESPIARAKGHESD